jgi:hypothetical protein
MDYHSASQTTTKKNNPHMTKPNPEENRIKTYQDTANTRGQSNQDLESSGEHQACDWKT